MKKNITFMTALLFLFYTGCVPTPNEELITQKNQDEMIQQALETAINSTTDDLHDYPKQYQFTHQDDSLSISIDAKIVVPEKALPIARVYANGFDQELVFTLFNSLSNGETCYTNLNGVQTKDEIASELEKMQQALNDGSYADGELNEDEWKMVMKELQNAYQAAPDRSSSERVITDGTMKTIKGAWGNSLLLDASSENYDFFIESSFLDQRDGFSRSRFYFERRNSPDYSMINARKIDETSESSSELKLSYHDAIEKAYSLLDLCNMPITVRSVYIIDDAEDLEEKGKNHAYCIFFNKNVEGISVAIDETETMQNDDMYQLPWLTESIQLIIDDRGIARFQWTEPLTISEIITDQTNLLPFSEICSIVEKMMPIVFLQYSNGSSVKSKLCEVNCDEVRLELIRVREKNATRSLRGLLVPAWVFYGKILDETIYDDGTKVRMFTCFGGGGGNEYYDGPTIVFCINAVDGSIINPILGY